MKRIFDILVSLSLLVLLTPIALGITLAILLIDGRPILYISERMKAVDQPFWLLKFRTMKNIPKSDNTGISGGDKASRITKTGHFLRKFRLDEIPQLINVLIGDMSLVGPRPPLRQYTKQFPDTYREVLKARPGITGLATIAFHKHEECLIRDAKTAEETDRIYVERCIPRKARLDMLYQENKSIRMDICLLYLTLVRVAGLSKGR